MLPVCHNRQTRQKAGRQAMRLRDQPPVPVVGLWAIGSDAVTCRIGKPKRGGFVAMRQIGSRHPCVRRSTWPGSTAGHCALCPRRSTGNRHCRFRISARSRWTSSSVRMCRTNPIHIKDCSSTDYRRNLAGPCLKAAILGSVDQFPHRDAKELCVFKVFICPKGFLGRDCLPPSLRQDKVWVKDTLEAS
jgi:hypothetical protein